MKTVILDMEENNLDSNLIKKGAQMIKNGGVVAFPTETVYGLGANALDTEAVQKIFKAKGRPSDNPLIVHVSSIDEVNPLVKALPKSAIALMKSFWPGPLTIVLEKSEKIPSVVSAGLDTVALRMPDHPIALALIKETLLPIAAPSANISGRPSPTKGEHVIEDLNNRVEGIVVGDDCHVGLESTVLDMTGEVPMILRPGGVTREALETVLGKVEVDPNLNSKEHTENKPKSPGMKYTHYAPKAKVIIIKGEESPVISEIKKMSQNYMDQGSKVGVLCFDETISNYQGVIAKSMGSRENLQIVASNVFRLLREFDKTDVDIILTEGVEEKEIGQAVMNRLTKAAAYRIISV
ncbi:L-threonylcarbamoyladenylate synthase [Serpentinicella sp. ANB-PHB4]|uniref:L-threonylcarbamoyladenylate synthase n=1 Tax=Serpentinicella sp. ANB-PHB4 TaxID=3074076 RepID=UPI00285BA83A|nr:L-threonylcarbamoyladenylate synthase [Serpentinicella sp. ANB-PHB4]MDR5659725.1 L-threonylcarbamoyladenylate synthase [Serpentinicella sp. ANB-PHB4]